MNQARWLRGAWWAMSTKVLLPVSTGDPDRAGCQGDVGNSLCPKARSSLQDGGGDT